MSTLSDTLAISVEGDEYSEGIVNSETTRPIDSETKPVVHKARLKQNHTFVAEGEFCLFRPSQHTSSITAVMYTHRAATIASAFYILMSPCTKFTSLFQRNTTLQEKNLIMTLLIMYTKVCPML